MYIIRVNYGGYVESKLVEKIMDLNEDPLARILYKKTVNPDGWEKGHWQENFTKAYCVYLDSEHNDPQGVIFKLTEKDNLSSITFKHFIEEAQPRNLFDTQFLIKFYEQFCFNRSMINTEGPDPEEVLRNLSFIPNQNLDEFLFNTRGVIMWNHQYLQLLQLVFPGFEKTPNLLWHLGLNKKSYWEKIEQVQLGQDSLKTLLKDRLKCGLTSQPPLRTALSLWDHLANRGQ
jgi:hypothetical protein